MATVVEAINLKKKYMLGKIPVEALRGANLKVKEANFYLFLGRLEVVNKHF
jgi:ABC-type multidrug transport system ATPase subunit